MCTIFLRFCRLVSPLFIAALLASCSGSSSPKSQLDPKTHYKLYDNCGPNGPCFEYDQNCNMIYGPYEGSACNDNDGQECTNGVCRSGFCNAEPVPGSPACETNLPPDVCQNRYCSNGTCFHDQLSNKPCADDQNPCTKDVCVTGECRHQGTPNERCALSADKCKAAVCVGSTCTAQPDLDVKCPPQSCKNGVCVPETGNCNYTNANMGTPCGGQGCFQIAGTCDSSGVCSGGTPKNCAIEGNTNTCIHGVCNEQTGQCTTASIPGATCTLGACFKNPRCEGGKCVGDAVVCEQPTDPCLQATCENGACANSPKTAGAPCSTACLINGACSNGKCIGTVLPNGARCPRTGCANGRSSCQAGVCQCDEVSDASAADARNGDGGAPISTSGCAYAGSSSSDSIWLALAMVFFITRWRRKSVAQ